jgi:hypothetical protein
VAVIIIDRFSTQILHYEVSIDDVCACAHSSKSVIDDEHV